MFGNNAQPYLRQSRKKAEPSPALPQGAKGGEKEGLAIVLGNAGKSCLTDARRAVKSLHFD